MTIRVLVAEDQAAVRAGLVMILRAEPDFAVVGEAADGERAVELALELRPDVVLMDVQMPRLDGVAATRRITEAGAARVLVLTTFDLDEYVHGALRAGAAASCSRTWRRRPWSTASARWPAATACWRRPSPDG